MKAFFYNITNLSDKNTFTRNGIAFGESKRDVEITVESDNRILLGNQLLDNTGQFRIDISDPIDIEPYGIHENPFLDKRL